MHPVALCEPPSVVNLTGITDTPAESDKDRMRRHAKALLEGAPTAPQFKPAILYILAERTLYQRGRTLQAKTLYKAIRDARGLEECPWPLRITGWRYDGIEQRIRKAYGLLKKQKLVLKKSDRGMWGLTPAGLAAAARIRGTFAKPDAPNITSLWLTGFMNPVSTEAVVRRIEMRFPQSREEAADFWHRYIAAVLARDGFRAGLSRGQHPTVSRLAEWACRDAITKFREAGKDAHLRATTGALTERDRRLGRPSKDQLCADGGRGVFLGQDAEGQSEMLTMSVSSRRSRAALIDAEGGDLRGDIDVAFGSAESVAILEKAVRRWKSGNPERYVRMLHYRLQDLSTQEIAERENVSINRANTLKTELKKALVQARLAGALDEARDLAYSR